MSDNAALLDRFLAAWLRKDIDGVAGCLGADVVYSGPDGSIVRGREAVAAIFAEQLDGDPALTIEPIAVRVTAASGTSRIRPPTTGPRCAVSTSTPCGTG